MTAGCADVADTGATHALVGFSKGLMTDLDRLLPAGSVVVLEEADVIEARDVARRLRPHRSAAALLAAPIQDDEDQAGLLRSVGPPGKVRVVIPAVEYGVVAAAVLAGAWDLPGAGLRAARIFRDKAALRRIADAAGLPQPRWRIADGPADVAAFAAAMGRCVLKPTSRQASLGVQIVGPGDDPLAAWERTVSVTETRQRARRAAPVRHLVEEYLPGQEISAESLVENGAVIFTNITAKQVSDGPWPVELGHVVPAALAPQACAAVTASMERLAAAAGFRTGVLHAEWILLDGASPHLVECAARMPGDSIDELIDLAYGGSITADLVCLLGGGRAAHRQEPRRGAAIAFLTCPPGVIEEINGVEEAQRADGVREVVLTAAAGAVVAPLRSSWDRIGHVIASGPTGPDAQVLAARAAALITVAVK